MDKNTAMIDGLRDIVVRSELKGCVVGVWAAAQDDEFKEVFNLLRTKPNINLTEVLNVIKQANPNLPFKRTSFIHHLKGNCICQTA